MQISRKLHLFIFYVNTYISLMYFDTAPPWRDGSTKGVTSFVTAARDPAKRENPRNLFPAAKPQSVTNYKKLEIVFAIHFITPCERDGANTRNPAAAGYPCAIK
jgi:hypothetical protein